MRPAAFHTSFEVELPLAVHESAPRPNHVAQVPSFEQNRFAAILGPTMVASASLRTPWRQPSSVAVVTRPAYDMQPPMTSRSAPLSRSQPGDPMAFARIKVDRLAMVSTAGQPSPPENATTLGSMPPGGTTAEPTGLAHVASGVEFPSARPRETTRPAPSEPTDHSLASLDRHASPPDFDPGSVSTPSRGGATGSDEPNSDELAASIRGNNVALRKLAAQLYEDRAWDAKSLAAVLDQLTPLVQRKDDLKLIRELIPPKDRGRVGELESGSDLISDLGSKIARARSQVQKGEFRGTLGERKTELDQLDRLSQRLANLVFRD